MFYIFMFDCLPDIKITGFETYLYFLINLNLSETACWIVESMITVNGNTVMIPTNFDEAYLK